jgi:hypothetical protein
MQDPAIASCGPNGTNPIPLGDYTCNAGYYASPAPVFCSRVFASRDRARYLATVASNKVPRVH